MGMGAALRHVLNALDDPIDDFLVGLRVEEDRFPRRHLNAVWAISDGGCEAQPGVHLWIHRRDPFVIQAADFGEVLIAKFCR